MATATSMPSSPPASHHSASDEATATDGDYLRRVARKLEGDLDVRLSSYAKLGGFSDKKCSSNDAQWTTLEMEIEILLAKLSEVNEDMNQWTSATTVGASATTAAMQRLARHREILHELTQEYKRTKKNMLSIKEHAELLTSVRNEINEHKTKLQTVRSEGNLLRERAAIHGSITLIHEIIDQTEATRSALTAQRSAFSETQGKVKHLNGTLPSIRVILGAIKRKKSKDNIILSAVIAVCTLFLIAYWYTK